jgi:hypothetical protein
MLVAHRHHHFFASIKEYSTMSIKSADVLSALKKHVKYLQDSVHSDIVRALEKEGLAVGGGGKVSASTNRTTAADLVGRGECLSVVQASAIPRNAEKIRLVLANAKRLGFDFDPSETIDVAALDRALAGKTVPERMRFKESLYELRLIPA